MMIRKEEKKLLVRGLYTHAKEIPQNYLCPNCGRKQYINPQGKIKCRCGKGTDN